MSTSDHIAELVEPILAGGGAELYDVELTGATVRVLVDRPDGAVTLADLESLSRAIADVVDLEQYELEVSSPGLERPLRRPDHFARAVGTAVKIKTRPDADGERRLDGTVIDADADAVTVETATGPRRLAYGDIERARTVFEWGPAPKPGSRKRSTT
jgi:ribosome maturation factor RimP